MAHKPFVGQYIGGIYVDKKLHGYLTVNVDHDRPGQGIVYLASFEKLDYRIYESEIQENDKGDLGGKVRRSERLERIRDANRTVPEAEQKETSFTILRGSNPHRLIYEGEQREEILLTPLDSSPAIEVDTLRSWEEFKVWASNTKSSDQHSIFRGVAYSSYDLRTSFHRTGRVDLERWRDLDMPRFVDFAETVGGLKSSENIGANWGFAQHHGFPTPLLDWTESPYIAAYFAFLERLEKKVFSDTDDSYPVRIYYLDGAFVTSNKPNWVNVADVFPRLWIYRPSSKGNQRLVFQQGIFLHSNVVAIEEYLHLLSKISGRNILKAIDLPSELAKTAIKDLNYMGVNHLSLFPGLDGAAKYLAIQQFYLG